MLLSPTDSLRKKKALVIVFFAIIEILTMTLWGYCAYNYRPALPIKPEFATICFLAIIQLFCALIMLFLIIGSLNSKEQNVITNFEQDLQLEKVTFVLGNGFDLDLGLHCSYKDFFESPFWPFKGSKKDSLGNYLNNSNEDGWHDLEDQIGIYAKDKVTEIDFEEANKEYHELTESFKAFLQDAVNKTTIRRDSFAYDIINNISSSDDDWSRVYSFNFTNINSILKANSIYDKKVRTHFIHGSLENNDIILGVGDNVRLYGKWTSFYKTYSPQYTSSGITERLSESDIVVIFGHSLTKIDFPYFEDFFNKIALNESKCKKVIIYTYDNKSVAAIKDTIRVMCHGNLSSLMNYAQIQFIMTRNTDPTKTREHKEFLNSLFHLSLHIAYMARFTRNGFHNIRW